MDIEERLSDLEKTVMDALASEMGMDLVVRALIATHPDPRLLKDVLKTLFVERESRIRDFGFEKGYAISTSQSTADALHKVAEGWLRLFPAGEASE